MTDIHVANPQSRALFCYLSDGANGVRALILVSALSDELVADLDPGLEEVLVQLLTVATQKSSSSGTSLR